MNPYSRIRIDALIWAVILTLSAVGVFLGGWSLNDAQETCQAGVACQRHPWWLLAVAMVVPLYGATLLWMVGRGSHRQYRRAAWIAIALTAAAFVGQALASATYAHEATYYDFWSAWWAMGGLPWLVVAIGVWRWMSREAVLDAEE